ncbi:hypothetical protein MEZE111188_19155 [Mesobacillus zeae]
MPLRKHWKSLGLENETKKLVGKYSLGMKQRLGIARALLQGNVTAILQLIYWDINQPSPYISQLY